MSEQEQPEPTADELRSVLSRWASGVAVVTTNDNGLLYGLTVSSFTSVSLDPPLVLVSLANANRLTSMIETSHGFAVSLLSAQQEAASNYFARPGRLPTPDFTEIAGEWTPSGQPVIAGSLGWLSCSLHAVLPQGDHTLVIGRVNGTGGDVDQEPLVYWSRAYRRIT
ncbi:MAG: flavin reductase [Alphaproteobacteria bacterium]|nr:flavin reductase [Alphaproteobacteria bacterium]MCB9695491.1 flavin reductase [Alphaproteobacteria bacterium]